MPRLKRVSYKRTRVKKEYSYNYIKMKYPNVGEQQDALGKRLATLMNKYNMTPKDVAMFANQISDKYNFKVTASDIRGYLRGVSPKTDKKQALMETFGVDEVYLCGYGFAPPNKRKTGGIV